MVRPVSMMAVAPTTVLFLLGTLNSVNAVFSMSMTNFIAWERIDPIVTPGAVAGHVHAITGGSNFGFNVTTEKLRKSECTTAAIKEDKSNYWVPSLYFQWANGSVSSVDAGPTVYYLFDSKPGTTKAFPPDFRMISGDPTLRTYDPNSVAQKAIDFLCVDGQGYESTRTSGLPTKPCLMKLRAQINFPSCWDGKNVDSPDHKSHMAFPSLGPDAGSCLDPKYPVTVPRIFMEIWWETAPFNQLRAQAKNPEQPFVFSHGDPTGFGNHADFYNGWAEGVLEKAVDGCNCTDGGDFSCCVAKGLFTRNDNKQCRITKSVDEQTLGTLAKLPGNNPIRSEGKATMLKDPVTPGIIAPVYVYRDGPPTQVGKIVTPPKTEGSIKSPTIEPAPPSALNPTSSSSSQNPPDYSLSPTFSSPSKGASSVPAQSPTSPTTEGVKPTKTGGTSLFLTTTRKPTTGSNEPVFTMPVVRPTSSAIVTPSPTPGRQYNTDPGNKMCGTMPTKKKAAHHRRSRMNF